MTASFLPERTPRPLTLPGQSGLKPLALHIGQGQNAIEVGVVQTPSRPTVATLQTAWKARRAGRASPLLLAALYEDKAAICGPSGEDPPVRFDLDGGQAERLCRAALEQPDRHAALAFVGQALPSLETAVPGLRNEGLFALHALSIDAQRRTEWRDAASKSKTVVARRGQDLLSGLGFTVERLDNLTLLLRGKVRRSALAVLVDPSEIPEAGVPLFNNLSPISYALAKADAEGLPWVVMVHGDRLRLYPTSVGVGVGRRGRTETYVEVQTSVLSDEHLGYLWLLLSADSLDPEGPVAELLEGSKRFAGDLADRLRKRIYEEVVPRLAIVIAGARKLKAPKAEDLDLTYRMALTVLFRLLFIAYAEDRDLLPYRTNEAYRRRSLKQKAQELAEARIKGISPAPGNSHWQEVTQLFRAVAVGNPEWGVPAYDGGLFTTDATISPPGAALAKIDQENGAFEPALQSLLLIETPEGPLGPVDFRALGVREFGTIYEGLLESELAVAEMDLGVDKDVNYVPHKPGREVVVRKGEIYLHDRSGARKSSGSYFTKSFAVDHLLDRALEPALDDHLARLDAMDDADATEGLFDFRVADIAMGSGHFLVAAIDRIERRFADYLNRRPLPGVRRELDYLRQAAEKSLADDASHALIEDAQLLRRLIARRSIYGVDLNPLSVELARLSIWIHTFVPGLPLTVLDHGLVPGNALVGIGSIAEIRERFEREATQLFPVDADNLLGQAKQPLARLGKLADASLKDVDAARSAMEEARLALGPTRAAVLRRLLFGQRRDVLLLTATPVNNSLWDLFHLVRFYVRQDAYLANRGVLSIYQRFHDAMRTDPSNLSPDVLYPIIDATCVKRTRQFVKKHYEGDTIKGPEGRDVPIVFPQPRAITVRYELDEPLPDLFDKIELYLDPDGGEDALTFARYTPESYLHGAHDPEADAQAAATVGLIRSGLLKRFESSAYALKRTLEKLIKGHEIFLEALGKGYVITTRFIEELGPGDEGSLDDLLAASDQAQPARNYNDKQLGKDVRADLKRLSELLKAVSKVKPRGDPKLRALVAELKRIAADAEEGATTEYEEKQRRKVLIFSFFADTVHYIREHLDEIVSTDPELSKYKGRAAAVTGGDDAGEVSRQRAIYGFAPVSTEAPPSANEDLYDILVTTDVLAEGVNLQQCRHIINADIPWNPMRLVQRHGRIDRIGSQHPRVFLRTIFPADRLDDLLNLEQRILAKIAMAAASIGVVAPVEGATLGTQVFTETREEIERLLQEDHTLYERGGTAGAAQTGEEYRQTLRKELEKNRDRIEKMPWKAGSGMAKGRERGVLFCASVGERTYLRFVRMNEDWQVQEGDEAILGELGTCLRLAECEPKTPRVMPEALETDQILALWEAAQDSIWRAWMVDTDPANLQPRLRPLNLKVAEFIRGNVPPEVDANQIRLALDILESPWPRREEAMLREWYEDERRAGREKARHLVEQILATGLEAFREPPTLPPIRKDEIELVCWLAIAPEAVTATKA